MAFWIALSSIGVVWQVVSFFGSLSRQHSAFDSVTVIHEDGGADFFHPKAGLGTKMLFSLLAGGAFLATIALIATGHWGWAVFFQMVSIVLLFIKVGATA
jgi:hypothetical protein